LNTAVYHRQPGRLSSVFFLLRHGWPGKVFISRLKLIYGVLRVISPVIFVSLSSAVTLLWCISEAPACRAGQ